MRAASKPCPALLCAIALLGGSACGGDSSGQGGLDGGTDGGGSSTGDGSLGADGGADGGGGHRDGGAGGDAAMRPLACGPGQLQCEGRCVDPDTDRAHCGGCAEDGEAAGFACGDGQVCTEGECARNCGGVTPLLCGEACVNPINDRTNCGGCAGVGGALCAPGEVCSEEMCQLSCGGRTPMLCGERCVDPATSRIHCGGCAGEGGVTCPSGRRCVGSECVMTCGGATPIECDGRCVDPMTDRNHCGGCHRLGGMVCASGEVCRDGSCDLECGGATPRECLGGCYDTTSDPRNCGGCAGVDGTRCGRDERCVDGACFHMCEGGESVCSGRCTDLTFDPNNCGECGTMCTAAPGAIGVCHMGRCYRACDSRHGDCDGDLRAEVTNGCEIDVLDNPVHCGGCGRTCDAPASSGAMCVGPECFITCSEGWGDCNDDRYDHGGDGCETRTYYDAMHCGGCGMPCPVLSESVPACAEGRCLYSCADGFGDCNGDTMPVVLGSDGCESEFQTDRSNCGACGNTCRAGESCLLGRCRGPHRVVFISSRMYRGNLATARTDGLTGIAAADAECTEMARAAGIMESDFYAWLSGKTDSFVWASPLTRFYGAAGNYVLVDGTIVATDWADLTDGTLRSAINLDERGNPPPEPGAAFMDACRGDGIPFWSNTTSTGILASPSGDCDGTPGVGGGAGFVSSTMGGSVWGNTARTDANWSNACGITTASGSCGWLAPILCVEQ